MTVAATTRKAGPYTGNGTTTEFAFTFKVFEASDLVVARTSDDGEVTLALNTDYSVSLNSDQDNNPGGKVTLKAALEDGALLAIVSAVSYDQLAIFTNKGGFYPETLNECYDKLTILVQQLLEELSRTIKVDVTDTMSSSELKQKLLDAAESATVVAKGYAESAKQSADSAAASAAQSSGAVEAARKEGDAQVSRIQSEMAGQLDRVVTATDGQIERIVAAGDAQVGRESSEGDAQVERIISAGESVLTRNQLKCLYGTISYGADQVSGATVTLPAGVSYVVGLNHLRLSVNGVVLYLGKQYEEVGNECYESTQIKLLMPLKTSDVLQAWVVPMGGKLNEETGEVVPDEGAKCQYGVWEVTSASDTGATITLPITYVAGKNHLNMSVNGLVLQPYSEFSEIGATGTESKTITLKFPLAVGDEVCAWTVPYDRGTASDTDQKIEDLQNALADLSRKVVYKEES